ncbi:MAG TPA: AMIN domain-containing protein [Candidatus Sulfotelmatobacter sp.]|jgi:hypothetical protein|nr:AMIN domain-containing protein [Candidatus Sulfotelmatobacter sp.]
MKLTTGILAMAMMTGGLWAAAAAQNPDAIDNARSTAKSLQQKQSNGPSPAPAPAKAKPAPGAPAPAVKPAAIPSSKPEVAAKTGQHNQLEKVNVVKGADSVQIEISSSQPVTPRLSTLKSPNRVLVEFPETVIASSQSKIAVGSAGVKGVRIGMDGKTPPTTSVVIDLEKPLAYDLTAGAAGKTILTLHAQGPTPSFAGPAPAKAAAVAAPKVATPAQQPKVAAKAAIVPTKIAVVKAPVVATPAPASKPDPKQHAKAAAPAVVKIAAPATKIAAPAASAPIPVGAKNVAAPAPKPEEKKWAMSGKRDPFFSPVVQQNGSGCATGKKCLEIGTINLRGVVKSDSGFIAVVTNNLNKAYFLRENDPVFNGYVVKITGDSVVFQETIQDKLGKSFTREVVKRIFTPAV